MKSTIQFITLILLLASTGLSNAETREELIQRLGDPIDWKTDAWEAYQLGIKRSLPVVLVLVTPLEDGVRLCNRMRSIVLSDDFQPLAGKAVFCLTSPDTDEGAKQLDEAFDVTGYPITLVLEPDKERLIRRGSVLGCPTDVAELRTHLDPLLAGN
ncbi:MAG: hypothetical protein AAGH89_00985 [Verrucomicrobiota bacterium]